MIFFKSKLIKYTTKVLFVISLSLFCCKKDFSTISNQYGPPPPTTSHEFTWEVYEFGTIGSYLRDVFIIDHDNIWAVGVIFPDPDRKYNVVHWNGEYWEMKKMLADAQKVFPGGTGVDSLFVEGQTVYAFGPNEIIIFAGTIQYFNGTEWQQNKGDLRIRESWGNSKNNLYFCGLAGLLLYFDGHNVQLLESLTKGNISDIFGVINSFNNKQSIFYAVNNLLFNEDHKIIEILPNKSTRQFPWKPDIEIESIWFDDKNNFYACGEGVWYLKNNEWKRIQAIPPIFTRKVRANHENDVFVVGDFGLMCHYNGLDWHIYPSLVPNSSLLSVDVKEDLVVIVGTDGSHAYIIKGTRN